jgi:hypothetical protein
MKIIAPEEWGGEGQTPWMVLLAVACAKTLGAADPSTDAATIKKTAIYLVLCIFRTLPK